MAAVKHLTFPTRKVSYTEYGHACIGTYKPTREKPRENTIVIEGRGDIDPRALQQAVDVAAGANPGVRLKLEGKRQHASWVDSGKTPDVRRIEQCEWDGQSAENSAFMYDKPLSARDGVIGEFIIANTPRSTTFLIFRSLHATMDGLGCMHFIEEVFRALNQRDPLGSNLFISGTELMRKVKATRYRVDASRPIARLTGGPADTPPKNRWWRLTFQGPTMWLLAKVAAGINEYCHQYNDGPVRVAIPVNLRRHAPGNQTTLNYATMVHIDLEATDNLATFNKKLHTLVNNNSEAFYRKWLELSRYLPMSWLDFWRTGNARAINKRKCVETATVSDLGSIPACNLSTGSFEAEHLFGIPLTGGLLCIISTLDETVNITIGMPGANEGDGRLEDFVQYMQNVFAA